jgi:hypothetical protein
MVCKVYQCGAGNSVGVGRCGKLFGTSRENTLISTPSFVTFALFQQREYLTSLSMDIFKWKDITPLLRLAVLAVSLDIKGRLETELWTI